MGYTGEKSENSRGDPCGRPGPVVGYTREKSENSRDDPCGRPGPPGGDPGGRPPSGPACPYCGSTDTELFSLFGQQLLTVQYYCNACHTPFERIKDDDVLEDYEARKGDQP